jgi:hypothetical protein
MMKLKDDNEREATISEDNIEEAVAVAPRRRYPRRCSVTKFNLNQVDTNTKTAAQQGQQEIVGKSTPITAQDDSKMVSFNSECDSSTDGQRESTHSSLSNADHMPTSPPLPSRDENTNSFSCGSENKIEMKEQGRREISQDAGVARGNIDVCKICTDFSCKDCQGIEETKKTSTFRKLMKATSKRRLSVRELLGRPNISKAA